MPLGTVVCGKLVGGEDTLVQMLLIASGKSPWVEVSRERLLNAAIAEHDQDHKTL